MNYSCYDVDANDLGLTFHLLNVQLQVLWFTACIVKGTKVVCLVIISVCS